MHHPDHTPTTIRYPLAAAAAFVVGVSIVTAGFAAPSAGAKASGQYSFYGSSAHASFSSARSHAGNYQRYLNETHGVPLPATESVVAAPAAAATIQIAAHDSVDPKIAREASDAIADDIARIQRHVDRMQEEAQSRGDKESLAELADVERQLGVARRGHAALHELHAEDKISPTTAMDLAQKVNAALRAAHAEHDEVMARLGKPTGR